MIRFFPTEPIVRSEIQNELRRMVPNVEALQWLTNQVVTRVRDWPGIVEIRGLLETRYTAADGAPDPGCTIPGFTAEDGEREYLARMGDYKSPSLLGAERLRELAEAANRQPKEVAKPKPRPATETMRLPQCTCKMEMNPETGLYERLADSGCPRHMGL